jgi:hypothetical protein
MLFCVEVPSHLSETAAKAVSDETVGNAARKDESKINERRDLENFLISFHPTIHPLTTQSPPLNGRGDERE